MTSAVMSAEKGVKSIEETLHAIGLPAVAVRMVLSAVKAAVGQNQESESRAHTHAHARNSSPSENIIIDQEVPSWMNKTSEDERELRRGWLDLRNTEADGAGVLGLIEQRKAECHEDARQASAQEIYESFRMLNIRKGGRMHVRIGMLLNFLAKYRNRKAEEIARRRKGKVAPSKSEQGPLSPKHRMMMRQMKANIARQANHESDLIRLIGQDGYRERIRTAQEEFGCTRKEARLVVHGDAVVAREIMN